MTLIRSPVDALVLVMLLLVGSVLITAMVRARRPNLWVAVWAVFFGLFLLLEMLGAPSGNTLSENIIASLPLPIVIGGTVGVAVVLILHWQDLAARKKGKDHANDRHL